MNPKEPVSILLVDDQPAKLLSYGTILAELGENLFTASSANEALDLLLKKEFAVVLVDVCMPELDGFELAALIRAHPRFQKTAIILVSSLMVEDVHRLKGYTSGAVDYVSVPIIPEILRAKVAVFADLYRKTDLLQRMNQELEQRVAERTAEIETAAARLRQSEERLRLALSSSGIRAWIWDVVEQKIDWEMPAGQTGVDSQSIAEFLSLVHPDDRSTVQAAYDRALAGAGNYEAEFRSIETADAESWLALGTVIHDSSGNPISIAGININITARKRTEDEKAALLKTTEEARRELEKAHRVKDEFLAVLSHELRTPLNAITGWAYMLRAGGLDPETQAKAVETINRNAFLQARLISDILDVSRIVSGKLHLEFGRLDLGSVIRAALDTIRPAAEAKNIHIHAVFSDEIAPIWGDAARLQQVVWNLLTNAVKFAPTDGHVQVRTEKRGSVVELTVQDDGPGIEADFLPHIFERFRQGDSSSTRAHHGLGLGLAIVRHLVEMHDGGVRAKNREDGTGAVFKVVLPATAPQAEPLVSGRASSAVILPDEHIQPVRSLNGLHVLVVDDEADSREVVALVFQQCGAEVTAVGSANEAFNVIKREPVSVLVADIEMPGEDGYSLVRRIRALPSDQGGQTPAIALTAYAGSKDRAKILKAGFQMHVPKPIHAGDLTEAVSAVVADHVTAPVDAAGFLKGSARWSHGTHSS